MTTTPPIQPTLQSPVAPDFRLLFDYLKLEFSKNINCARIGIIQSFDAAEQTATVQIAQKQVTSIQPDGTQTLAEYAPLLRVPVFYPCGGGYTLTFPVKAGDECLVVFNDREIDNWLINGGVTTPGTPRIHDVSDGMAFVGFRSNPRKLNGVSTSTTQLRSDDGQTFVEVDGAGHVVTLTAPTQIKLNSPVVTVQGIINVINENNIANPCTIEGKITATGDIVADSGATNISLVNHVHTNVQPGSGNTGPATG